MRRGPALCLLAAALLSARAAAARDVVQACIDDHARGQKDQQSGALIAAEAAYIACAERRCPVLVQKECVTFLERVRALVPQISIRALLDGREAPEAILSIDGRPLPADRVGRPVKVDPGRRTIEVDFGERGVAREVVVVQQGDPVRDVSIQAPAPPSPPRAVTPLVAEVRSQPSPPRAEPSGRLSPFVPVLGGVAVAGLGAFAFFGLTGLDRESELETACGPRCSSGELDGLRRRYLVADISLGVGLLASAAAAWVLLRGQTR